MNESWRGYNAAHALRTGGRDEVRSALLAARARTLLLAQAYADALGPHDLRVPCQPILNPPLWEWGHVAWFQEWWIARNQQRERGIACDSGHARTPSLMHQADELFDSSRVEHATRWELTLPDLETCFGWLEATLAITLSALDDTRADAQDDELYFFRLVALHEEMHAEAACYMARTVGFSLPSGAYRQAPARGGGEQVLRIPEQEFFAGWSGPGFAFDNELGATRVPLAAFEIDAQPLSRTRFAAFEEAGGYRERRWWDDAGWAWLCEREQPRRHTLVPDDAAAAHISAFEADAWCRWAGRRLPTEFEWECAALTTPDFHWGEVWEWTASAFQPYPGFVPHPYRDYSAPWFGTRRVLRGASSATAATLAHPRYRNFFEPHRCDIPAGFRTCA